MYNSEKPVHHCGVAGIYSKELINIPHKLFYLLFAQQHRGQESAGISYLNGENVYCYKDLGLVSQVLNRYLRKDISSNVGIGHVRYSTHGGSKVENAQPLHVTCNKGEISIAHNGNISNAQDIRKELSDEGAIFQTTSDTELILHLISRSRKSDIYEALDEVLSLIEGAFSFVLTYGKSLIGIRDPNGYRPLYLGYKDGMHVLVSETCALDSLGISEYREIEPGEVVIIDDNGVKSAFFNKGQKRQHCVFEMIYFARPDSNLFSHSIYETRKKMGAALAKLDNFEADMVISVPESGNVAALGYSQESGIPFEMGMTRNFYAGRSFILPTTEKREMAVRTKLNPIISLIKGKRIVVVDDSLVRGTTASIIIKILRLAGAKEIHFRLSSPELHFPCYYGIDIPTTKELISNRMSPDEIAKKIGADSLKFLPIEELQKCVSGSENFCYACFNGDHLYPRDEK